MLHETIVSDYVKFVWFFILLLNLKGIYQIVA